MGNRSKLVAVGGIAAAVVASRRRARARALADGIADAILPSQVEPPLAISPVPDPGAAPGHRHRRRGERGEAVGRARWSPWVGVRPRPRLVRR